MNRQSILATKTEQTIKPHSEEIVTSQSYTFAYILKSGSKKNETSSKVGH